VGSGPDELALIPSWVGTTTAIKILNSTLEGMRALDLIAASSYQTNKQPSNLDTLTGGFWARWAGLDTLTGGHSRSNQDPQAILGGCRSAPSSSMLVVVNNKEQEQWRATSNTSTKVGPFGVQTPPLKKRR